MQLMCNGQGKPALNSGGHRFSACRTDTAMLNERKRTKDLPIIRAGNIEKKKIGSNEF
jgi:hypothetical protein